MFDSYPVSPGHVLIIPVEPIVSLFELSQDQRNHIYAVIHKVKEKLEKMDLKEEYIRIVKLYLSELSVNFCKKALESLQFRNTITGYNIANNDGTSAGRTIDHLHIHIIPRFD
jgi:diadenosine tetraphosphate (Ap4A) HIT family hydrolase